MARPSRQRPLPSTPQVPPAPPPALAADASAPSEQEAASGSATPSPPVPRLEPKYLLLGTGCVAGHAPGEQLEAGRIGRVPTKRQSRIGFALVCWCFVGAIFLAHGRWFALALGVACLWLAFAAMVVRAGGHRGHCWRTRTWRHAWGGLAPESDADPTRPAGT